MTGELDVRSSEQAALLARVMGVGTSVAGRYRLETLIGRGGAATVWRARDVLLERPVALKVLTSRREIDPREARRRFLREARVCAAIRHPNVVDLLDFGAHEGRPFLVMELLLGEPLDVRFDREVQLEIDEAVALGVGLLDGLAAAHRAGVVHRDLKPANVFLVTDGPEARPKLLDFGVSRSVEPSLRRSPLTTTEGRLLGTPEYMSPEQARGSSDLDHRADLYSAAVILFESLAGVLPYRSESLADLIVEIVTGEPEPLSRIRSDVGPISDVLARAMEHLPDRRFASAREMRDALLEAHAALRAPLPARAPLLGRVAPALRAHRPHARRVSVPPTPLARTEPARAREAAPRPTPAASSAIAAPTAGARRHALASVLVGLALIVSGVALGSWLVWTAPGELAAPPELLSGPRVSDPPPQRDPAPAHAPPLDAPEPPLLSPGEPSGTPPPARRRAPRARTASPPTSPRGRDTPDIVRELDY